MKVLVIGGGIAGLTTAVALRQRGIPVKVYEARSELKDEGKGIWMPPNAMIVLDRLGLAEAVRAAGVPLSLIEIRDLRHGPLMEIDLHQVQARFGHTIVSLLRSSLQRILAGALESDVLELGKRCVDVVDHGDRVTVVFEDGSEAEGTLVVGADGIRSLVRKKLFPDVPLRYAGQTCYRGLARLTLHSDLQDKCVEVWGGARRFGFSAVGPSTVYWFAPQTAPEGAGAVTPDLPERLRQQYAAFPSPIPEIVEATPAEEIICTDLYDFPPLSSFWRGRVVLVGDAAHAMTPNLGQGGAQAIEDAYALAEALSGEASLEDALRSYELRRLHRVRRIVETAWQYGQVAHWESRVACAVRDFLLKIIPSGWHLRRIQWLYQVS